MILSTVRPSAKVHAHSGGLWLPLGRGPSILEGSACYISVIYDHRLAERPTAMAFVMRSAARADRAMMDMVVSCEPSLRAGWIPA